MAAPIEVRRDLSSDELRSFARTSKGEIVMIESTCVRVHQHGATGKKGDPMIAAWDVPEADSRARSTPSLTLTVVPSRCDCKQRVEPCHLRD